MGTHFTSRQLSCKRAGKALVLVTNGDPLSYSIDHVQLAPSLSIRGYSSELRQALAALHLLYEAVDASYESGLSSRLQGFLTNAASARVSTPVWKSAASNVHGSSPIRFAGRVFASFHEAAAILLNDRFRGFCDLALPASRKRWTAETDPLCEDLTTAVCRNPETLRRALRLPFLAPFDVLELRDLLQWECSKVEEATGADPVFGQSRTIPPRAKSSAVTAVDVMRATIAMPSDSVGHEKKTEKRKPRHRWTGDALDCANAYKSLIDSGDYQPLEEFCRDFAGERGGATLYKKLIEHRDHWDLKEEYKNVRKPVPPRSRRRSSGTR